MGREGEEGKRIGEKGGEGVTGSERGFEELHLDTQEEELAHHLWREIERLKAERARGLGVKNLDAPLLDQLCEVIRLNIPEAYSELGERRQGKAAQEARRVLKQADAWVKKEYGPQLSLMKGFPWKLYPKINNLEQILKESKRKERKNRQAERLKQVLGRNRVQDALDSLADIKNYDRSRELGRQLGLEPLNIIVGKKSGRVHENWWALVQPDFELIALDWSTAKPTKPVTVRKTIQALAHVGIIEDMGWAEERGGKIYKIGIWRWFPSNITKSYELGFKPLLNQEDFIAAVLRLKVV